MTDEQIFYQIRGTSTVLKGYDAADICGLLNRNHWDLHPYELKAEYAERNLTALSGPKGILLKINGPKPLPVEQTKYIPRGAAPLMGSSPVVFSTDDWQIGGIKISPTPDVNHLIDNPTMYSVVWATDVEQDWLTISLRNRVNGSGQTIESYTLPTATPEAFPPFYQKLEALAQELGATYVQYLGINNNRLVSLRKGDVPGIKATVSNLKAMPGKGGFVSQTGVGQEAQAIVSHSGVVTLPKELTEELSDWGEPDERPTRVLQASQDVVAKTWSIRDDGNYLLLYANPNGIQDPVEQYFYGEENDTERGRNYLEEYAATNGGHTLNILDANEVIEIVDLITGASSISLDEPAPALSTPKSVAKAKAKRR